MRRVTDPNGVHWKVDVSWTGVTFGSRFRAQQLERAQLRRRGRRGRNSGAGDPGSWLDALSPGLPDDLSGIVVAVVAIVVLLLVILAFPWLLVLLLDLAQILAFPLIAVAVIGWRVARHRPFAITADHGAGPILSWEVVGVREARRIERAIADAVVAGGDAERLFPEYAERR